MKPVQGKALSKHAPQTGNSWSVFTSPTRCNEETSVPVRSMFDTESPESVRQHDRMSACLVNNSAESLSGESSLTLIISCHYICTTVCEYRCCCCCCTRCCFVWKTSVVFFLLSHGFVTEI